MTASSIIATRTLEGVFDSVRAAVDVKVFLPAQTLPHDDWECRIEIDWPMGTRHITVGGVDAAQALILALQMTATNLYLRRPANCTSLTWLGSDEGLGFPLPPNLRDLARGEDRLL